MMTSLRLADGVVRECTPAEPLHDAAGFTWTHIEGTRDRAELDRIIAELPAAVAGPLTAVETRPRCELYGDGVLLNLRTVAAAPDDGGDPLVSIRIWCQRGLVISVSFREAAVLAPVRAQFMASALHDPGDIIIALVQATAALLDPDVAAIGDALDELETSIGPDSHVGERRRITRFRSKVINLRRFIQPQRLALERLAALPVDWLDAQEKALLRDSADRFARMAEELEAIRERAAVLQDELIGLRSERIDSRSLQISITALIFLPLTFITGLLGMNVGGIPYADESWAFWGVTGFCLLTAIGVSAWFSWRNWR